MLVELITLEEYLLQEEQQQALTPEQQQILAGELANVRNALSNESGGETSSRGGGYSGGGEDRGVNPMRGLEEIDAQLAETGRALSDRLKSNRENLEKGLREISDMRNAGNNNQSPSGSGSEEKTQDARIAGSVTASYDLGGRNAIYMPTPSYTCQGGGKVVVSVTVNQNGDVVQASINSSSADDNCMRDRSLEFAKMARFAIDTSAPAAQKGTITFSFVPQ